MAPCPPFPNGETPTADLVKSGESELVEFKSTATVNLKREPPARDSEMEFAVLKTVVAFMNARGGTLLIGVTDDGRVHGLRSDYTVGGRKNRDQFQNWLAGELVRRVGAAETKAYVIRVESIDGNELCRLDVSRVEAGPVFLDETMCFVRAGTRTERIEGKQLVRFSQDLA